MTGCVLRVSLPEGADLDKALEILPFEPLAVFRKGTPRGPSGGGIRDADGFNILVSDCEGESVTDQIVDAIVFLERYRTDLQRLSRDNHASLTIDFGTYFYDGVMSRTHRLPPRLLRLCGELEIGIDVSFYRTNASEN